MERVNEGSYFRVTASFVDEDGAAVTPDFANYRIDDQDSGNEIKETTASSPTGSTYEIEIPGEENIILNPPAEIETRVVTVSFVYDTYKVGTAEYRYRVFKLYNLAGLAAESS